MTRRRTWRAAFALIAALMLVAAPAALAWNPTDMYRELRCPTCETPLDVSNSPAAQRIKEFVLERWRKGWSEDRVKDALVADFGREVLATPPKSGFDLVAWVVPGVAVLGGLAGIAVLTRVWARRRRADDAPAAPLSDADAARLQSELDRLGGP
ncbi:MAG: cytochrome c-type biogenesis protein [Actinomycetota bacterium]